MPDRPFDTEARDEFRADFVVSGERPTIPEALPLVKAYYAKPRNGTGGSLHIVLEDGNVDQKSVEFCLAYAQEHDDLDGVELARLLLRMSRTQRQKLYRMSHYPEGC